MYAGKVYAAKFYISTKTIAMHIYECRHIYEYICKYTDMNIYIYVHSYIYTHMKFVPKC